jgi:hypothetical protein
MSRKFRRNTISMSWNWQTKKACPPSAIRHPCSHLEGKKLETYKISIEGLFVVKNNHSAANVSLQIILISYNICS